MTLEDIYVSIFNEILKGNFDIETFSKEYNNTFSFIKDRDKNTLQETRNTLLYKWYKDNNDNDIVKNIYDYVFMPNILTQIDLKGCEFDEIVFIISPETRKALGIEYKKPEKKYNVKQSNIWLWFSRNN